MSRTPRWTSCVSCSMRQCPESRSKILVSNNVVGQRLAKESARAKGVIHTAQTGQGDIAQTAAHGVADQQGAGEDRGADRSPQGNGDTRPTMVGE